MLYSKTSFPVCFFLPSKTASVQHRKGRTLCWPAVQISGSSTTMLLSTRYCFTSQSTSVLWIWVFCQFWSQWSYLLVSFLKPLLLVSSWEERAKYNLTEARVIYLTSLPFPLVARGPASSPCTRAQAAPRLTGKQKSSLQRDEVELFCLSPDKQESPINWISCM